MKVEENEENGEGDTIKDNHKDQPELANPLEPDCQVHENGTDQDTTEPEQANEEGIAEVEQNEDNLQSDNKHNEQEIDNIDELQHESEHDDTKQQVKLEEPTENGPPKISHDNALQTTAIDKHETQKLLEDEQSPSTVQKEEVNSQGGILSQLLRQEPTSTNHQEFHHPKQAIIQRHEQETEEHRRIIEQQNHLQGRRIYLAKNPSEENLFSVKGRGERRKGTEKKGLTLFSSFFLPYGLRSF